MGVIIELHKKNKYNHTSGKSTNCPPNSLEYDLENFPYGDASFFFHLYSL
jgi:hypothetical protein